MEAKPVLPKFCKEDFEGKKCLVIGLGTTGSSVVRRYKEELNRLIDGDSYNFFKECIALWCFDPAGTYKNDNEVFHSDEYFCPSVDIGELSEEIENIGQGEKKYLELCREGLKNLLMETMSPEMKGAGTLRPVAKYVLEKNSNVVKVSLTNKIEGLGVKNIKCIITGSLYGGTCSGTFIDIALLLRTIEDEVRKKPGSDINIEIAGVFTLPGLTDFKDEKGTLETASAVQALLELYQIFNKSREEKGINLKSVTGEEVNLSSKKKLYNYVFLINRWMNKGGWDYNQIDELLSYFLIYLSHPDIWEKKVVPWLTDKEPHGLYHGRLPEILSTFKIETFEIPITLWSEYTRSHILAKVVESLINPGGEWKSFIEKLENEINAIWGKAEENIKSVREGDEIKELTNIGYFKAILKKMLDVSGLRDEKKPVDEIEDIYEKKLGDILKDRGVNIGLENWYSEKTLTEIENNLRNLDVSKTSIFQSNIKLSSHKECIGLANNDNEINRLNNSINSEIKKIISTLEKLKECREKYNNIEKQIPDWVDVDGYYTKNEKINEILEQYINNWENLGVQLIEFIKLKMKYQYITQLEEMSKGTNNELKTNGERLVNDYRKTEDEKKKEINSITEFKEKGYYAFYTKNNIFEENIIREIIENIKNNINKDYKNMLDMLMMNDEDKMRELEGLIENIYEKFAKEKGIRPECFPIEELYKRESKKVKSEWGEIINMVEDFTNVKCMSLSGEEINEITTNGALKVVLCSRYKAEETKNKAEETKNVEFLKKQVGKNSNISFLESTELFSDRLFKITVITFYFGFGVEDIEKKEKERYMRCLKNIGNKPIVCFPEIFDAIKTHTNTILNALIVCFREIFDFDEE